MNRLGKNQYIRVKHFILTFFVIAANTFSGLETSRAQSVNCLEHVRDTLPVSKVATKALENNEFNIGRSFSDYAEKLSSCSDAFVKTLASLPPGSIYIDMGAGKGNAMMDIINNPRFKNITAIGLAYKRSYNSALELALKNRPERINYIDGDYIEAMRERNILDKYLGKASLISDLYGPASYSNDLSQLLKIYWDLLTSGGDLFLTIEIKTRRGGMFTSSLDFVNDNKRVYVDNLVTLNDLLSRIKGFVLMGAEPYLNGEKSDGKNFEEGVSIHLKKTSKDEFQMPQMMWIYSSAEAPPYRVYQVESSTPITNNEWTPRARTVKFARPD